MRTSLTRVEITDGHLREDGRPDHVLLRVAKGDASIDPLRLRVTRIGLHGGVLDFRETIDTGFVIRSGGRFPRVEVHDATVRLRGEDILTGERAILTRDERREYRFEGFDLVHRGLRADEVHVRLVERDGGAEVPEVLLRLLGGQVTGDASIRRDGGFEAKARATGIDLAALSVLLGSPTRTRFSGRLSGKVAATGSPYALDALRATGTVRAEDLVIRDEPILLDVLALLHGVRPDTTPFTSGEGRFEMIGGTLRILDAEVMGPRWGIRGEGEVDLVARTVDVEIVLVDMESTLGRVPVVGDRLRAASDALRSRVARARITGTFDRLRVIPTALEDIQGRMAEFVGRLLR